MVTARRAVLLGCLAVAVAGAVVAVAVARGWTPTEALPTGRSAHDRAVADLERRVAAEDGWVVIPVPNQHEGGGVTTWWLHPCDPASDDERAVVRTAFHGSDVAGLPGRHTVELDTVPCSAPTRRVDLGDGRGVRLDVEVVDLGSSFGLVEDREDVTIEDEAMPGGPVVATVGRPVVGPCDGRTAWTAWFHGSRRLDLRLEGCVGSLGALPDAAVALLDMPRPASQLADEDSATLDEVDLPAFGSALEGAGWEVDTIDVLTFDGTTTAPRWLGPCGVPAPDGAGATRPEVDWFAGTVEVREGACP